MKYPSTSIALILLVTLLAACAAQATPTEEVALSTVYTAAASTLASQETSYTPTSTATFLPTSTPFTLPTSIPATATVQNTISYSLSSTANGCNNAAYLSDVTIPDGTVLAPRETFVKTWEFQNTGTCDWNENYLVTFVSGSDMEGEVTEIDQDVSTGSTGNISVSLVAPDSEGAYTGYWRLADADGNVFGQSVYVMIVVSEESATLTPTPTSASEATSTSEPTSTSTSTATSEATATLEPTATPTATTDSIAVPTDTSTPTSTG